MSTPKDARGIQKMKFLQVSEKLAIECVRKVHDENFLPKKYKHKLADKIVDASIDAYTYANQANAIVPQSKPEYEMRLQLQLKAESKAEEVRSIVHLLPIMFENKNDTTVTNSSVRRMCELSSEAHSLLLAWRKSDQKRYSEYK